MNSYACPEVQVTKVMNWNAKYAWGFSESDFSSAQERAAELPAGDPRSARYPVLVPYLHDVGATFDALCRLLADVDKFVPESDLRGDPRHLRMLSPEDHIPGLRWEVIGLKDHMQTAPDVCRGPDSAHAGILAAAAHFDDWRKALGTKTEPEVFLTGHQASRFSDTDTPEWWIVPQLARSSILRKKLLLHGALEHPTNLYGTACPTIHQRL